ncbi:MAG TPA: EamA family transporter [Terriglobales bacterium]|nr:EamA family transporter [Terriglobales bacterium]
MEPDPQRPHLRGYVLIAAAACCWGGSAALGRALFTSRLAAGSIAPVSPLILTQTRISLAALILLPVLLWLRRGHVLLSARDAVSGLLLGLVGMSVSNYFYYLAIERTNVATAIVIQYTAPVWVLLYLLARGRQSASWRRLGAVALALLGICLVLGLVNAGAALRLDLIGVSGALLAAFAFAYYNLAGQSLAQRLDPILISLYMLVGAAVFFALIHPPWLLWQAHYTRAEWGFFLLFSLLATLAPTLLYLSGLKDLDATRAVVTSCLEPVSGILLAAVFLGEALNWLRWLGVACVIVAILLISVRAQPGKEQRDYYQPQNDPVPDEEA